MKKLLLVSLCFLMLCVTQTFAQNRTITGTVTAKEDGLPIPGVSVTVTGTTVGTQTNADGKFTINVPSTAKTLHFSFIGYSQLDISIGSSDVVNAVLGSDMTQLNEVVVTALGTTTEKRQLGYSQTTVKNETINKSSPIGLLGALQGKIAGVNISNVSGTPGGSTKVIIRGFSSITGTNQPLYVIDGVPFNNQRAGSDNNYDFGNQANDIDPNIIDNISVLKGSSATSLYGSRGSNGVILITTKKGKSGKPVVDINTSTTITDVAITYTPQKIFGQGWSGSFAFEENGSWGPKFDNKLRPWGATGGSLGSAQLIKPFSFIDGNVKSAFDKGIELNNNISVSGGNETSNYFMSYGNVYSNGVLPSDADLYKRNNVSLRGGTKYKKFEVDLSLNYVNNVRNIRPTGQGSSNGTGTFYESLLQIPTDIPIKDLRDYTNPFFNTDNYFTPYAENPYYSLFENGSRQTNNRVYGNLNVFFKPTDWLTLNFQQSGDAASAYGKIWNNKNIPTPDSWADGGNPAGAIRNGYIGSVNEDARNYYEYDSKLQALFNKKLNPDFDLNGFIGVNYNDRGSRLLITQVEDLAVPGFFQISNSFNKPSSIEAYSHRRIVGFYGQATAGYKNYLFLTVNGRNDITSTLAPGENSYFYPGANLAYVLTESLNMKSTALSFAKLRVSYGETGSDTDPYRIYNTLLPTDVNLGFGDLVFPLAGVAGYTVNNQLNNLNLKPERVKELELGGEFKFLNNRISLDFTYYNKVRTDQIIPLPLAPSSGYTSGIINFGKTRNRGIEVAFGATPVKSKDVQWDINYTFTRDRSMVLDLIPNANDDFRIDRNTAYDAKLSVIKGQPLGVIIAPGPLLDDEGHIVVNSSGIPVEGPLMNYGAVQSDFRMGLYNNIRVKDFTLGFTIDYNQGGKFYSGTADLLNFVGVDPKTTYNDRNPFIVPNSVQDNGDGTYSENTTAIPQSSFYAYWYPSYNIGTSYKERILTRTFVKLREVTLSYNLPKSLAAKVGASRASLTLQGRNLLVWLPSSNRTVDPEVSNLGSDFASEFGEFRTSPPLRYYGAALKVSF